MQTALRTAAALTTALALLVLAAPNPTAHAGGVTFNVDSLEDLVDANIGDNLCAAATGDCTLRAAIQETNLLGTADTIIGTADTIIVPAGIYELTIATPLGGGGPVDTDANGDLDIGDAVTIVGAGSDETIIDALDNSRVFDISQTFDSTVNISGLRVQNGNAQNQNGGGFQIRGFGITVYLIDVFIANSVGQYGGGIYVESNNVLFIDDSRIEDNTAVFDGGGIHILTTETVTITDTTIDGNEADSGAGIMNTDSASGTLIVERSDIRDNHAATFGGGIFNGADTRITDTNISDNQTLLNGGGGIYNASSELLNITSSLIAFNYAGGQDEGGGGIQQDSTGEINIIRSTLFGNTSNTVGGAMLIQDEGPTFIINSTIAGNFGDGGIYFRAEGALSLSNSIIADNGNTNCKREAGVGNTVVSDGPNISDDNSCTSANLIVDDPELSTLADNGGLTRTMAISESSPAIDAADEGHCAGSDQRGAPAFDGDGDTVIVCDIGAFEFGYLGRIWGDFNCDGEITEAGDALGMMLALVDLPAEPTTPCPAPGTDVPNATKWGDFGCDGAFEEFDTIALLAYLAATPDDNPTCPSIGATVLTTAS